MVQSTVKPTQVTLGSDSNQSTKGKLQRRIRGRWDELSPPLCRPQCSHQYNGGKGCKLLLYHMVQVSGLAQGCPDANHWSLRRPQGPAGCPGGGEAGCLAQAPGRGQIKPQRDGQLLAGADGQEIESMSVGSQCQQLGPYSINDRKLRQGHGHIHHGMGDTFPGKESSV